MTEPDKVQSSLGLPAGAKPGLLTLVGAGELMPAMSAAHRDALNQLRAPARAVFLDTTAGFESNADAITGKAVDYYKLRLQTKLEVASYRHAGRAGAAETARAVAAVRAANFIFAGPGSSTYALGQWRGSPLWDAIVDAFLAGTHMLFASAASITLGRYALPVYEIFKAGADPYWADGLDLLGRMGLKLAVVPHYDDNSGGTHYDSRFCYMGAARYELLQALLPADVTILGIDAYTAVRFDPQQRIATVSGQGAITVLADGAVRMHAAGSAVPFDALHSAQRVVVHMADEAPRTYGYEYGEPAGGEIALNGVHGYIEQLSGLDAATRVELLARVVGALRSAAPAAGAAAEPLLDLLLELRCDLRAAKQWALADKLRDAVVQLGYEVQDTATGSTWQPR